MPASPSVAHGLPEPPIIPDHTYIGRDMLTGDDVQLPLLSRMQGLYVLGKQGMGKSNFLLSLIAQDLQAGYGVCVLDPHGDLTVDVLALMPSQREQDVILLDLQDTSHPFAFDLFAGVDPADPESLANGVERVVGIFKKVWGDTSWGPRLEDLLANSVFTLLYNPSTTLAELPILLTDEQYRSQLVQRLPNDRTGRSVRDFWQTDYDSLGARAQAGIYAPLMNKVRSFLRHPILAEIVSQSGATVDFGQALAKSQILLVRLNAELAEATSLLGTAVVLRLLEAALKRKHVPVSQRPPFLLYADEFQRFATPTFGQLLEEARKYAVGTTLAHQHRAQLSTSYLQAAVKGAVNLVCFQLQADDAHEMSREFSSQRQSVSMPRDLSKFLLFISKIGDKRVRDLWMVLFDVSQQIIHAPTEEESREYRRIGHFHREPQAVLGYVGQRLRQAIVNKDRRSPIFERDVEVLDVGEVEGRAMIVLTDTFNELRDRIIALTSFDADMLVDLPRGQAAAKLQQADGVHQYLLTIPHSITPERSATVHAALRQDRVVIDEIPYKPTMDTLEAAQRARRIRECNRARYRPLPQPPPQTAVPAEQPARSTPPVAQPPTPRRPLPVMREVEVDE